MPKQILKTASGAALTDWLRYFFDEENFEYNSLNINLHQRQHSQPQYLRLEAYQL